MFVKGDLIMRSLKSCSIAVLALVAASSVLAQSTMTEPMPSQPAASTVAPSGMGPNGTLSAPAELTGAPMPAATGSMSSGASGTAGTTGSGAGYAAPPPVESGQGAGLNSSAGTSYYTPGGPGKYGDYGYGGSGRNPNARGMQVNANDVHATPQPASQDSQIYRGN